MGSGANNTARYLGGAAGAALMVSIASATGAHRITDDWNTTALVSAGICALGVAIVASCRTWRRDEARPGPHRSFTQGPRTVSRRHEHLPSRPKV
jgi:hypothetical protein